MTPRRPAAGWVAAAAGVVLAGAVGSLPLLGRTPDRAVLQIADPDPASRQTTSSPWVTGGAQSARVALEPVVARIRRRAPSGGTP